MCNFLPHDPKSDRESQPRGIFKAAINFILSINIARALFSSSKRKKLDITKSIVFTLETVIHTYINVVIEYFCKLQIFRLLNIRSFGLKAKD